MRFINLDDISDTDILAIDVQGSNGQLLARRGSYLTPKALQGIRKHHVYSVYVTDEISNEILGELHDKDILKEVIDPVFRQSAITKIRANFEKFNKSKDNGRYSDAGFSLLGDIQAISKEIINELLVKKDLTIERRDIKHMDVYDYEHSLNTAVFSCITGMALGLNEKELEILVQGALLMNIGVEVIGKEIFEKEGVLTSHELHLVREHTNIGRQLLSDKTHILGYVKQIVQNHHERMDGTGYPRGLKGNEIDKYSRIVMIADVYDSLTSDRHHRKAFTPNEALEFIMGGSSTQFDSDMVRAFAYNITPFPKGEYVKLSDGSVGVVIDVPKKLPLRPKVKVIAGHRIGKTVDLSVEMDIVVLRKVNKIKKEIEDALY